MPGVKGKSGPPGNLNGSRNPHRAFWQRRALKPTDRWVAQEVLRYVGGLESDKPDMTETERRMADLAATAHGCKLLILAAARDSGFIRSFNGSWDLTPGVKELTRFLGVERSALQALGLDRRERTFTDLARALQAAQEGGDQA